MFKRAARLQRRARGSCRGRPRRRRTPSSRMPGRCSKAPRLGIEGTRRRGTFGTKKARSRCPDDARLDALDRREVVGHEMPRLAIVPRVVELTRGRPRVHARRIVRIRPEPFPEDGEPRPALREALRALQPLLPAVRRAVHSHRSVRHYAVVVSDQRNRIRRLAIMRMSREREAERAAAALRDGQALLDDLPSAIASGSAVYSRVVLLIHDGRILRVPDHLVDARGEVLFFEQFLLAVVPDPSVVHSPGAARIVRREDPRGGDPNEHSPGVAGIREDRVEAETTTSGLPLFPTGVVIERVVGGPRFPPVLSSEQSRRFDSGIETSVLRGLKLPDPRDGDPGLLRESGTFMGGRPLASEVLRPRDDRPPVLARGARIYRLPV